MCLAKAYLEKNGMRELLMEEIAAFETAENKVLLKTLFGDQKAVSGRLKKVDFVANAIILEGID